MERNMHNALVQEGRVHPSAMLIKILMHRLSSQPELSDTPTAIVNFAETISEFEIVPRPHRLSTHGYSNVCLKKISISDDCSICREALPDVAVYLPCDHTFHSECIKEWFNTHSTCPICRTNIDYY